MNTPGEMQQTPCGLSPWADGRGNVGKSWLFVMILYTRDLNTATRVTHIPQHSAQGPSPQGITAPPQGGVNRHLMLQPPKHLGQS